MIDGKKDYGIDIVRQSREAGLHRRGLALPVIWIHDGLDAIAPDRFPYLVGAVTGDDEYGIDACIEQGVDLALDQRHAEPVEKRFERPHSGRLAGSQQDCRCLQFAAVQSLAIGALVGRSCGRSFRLDPLEVPLLELHRSSIPAQAEH